MFSVLVPKRRVLSNSGGKDGVSETGVVLGSSRSPLLCRTEGDFLLNGPSLILQTLLVIKGYQRQQL